MKIRTNIKIFIVFVGIFAAGFIGLQVLKVQSPEVEQRKEIVLPETRRITTSRFVKRTPRASTKTQQEEANINLPVAETTPVSEKVPTAQSDDNEIRDFIAWHSTLSGKVLWRE